MRKMFLVALLSVAFCQYATADTLSAERAVSDTVNTSGQSDVMSLLWEARRGDGSAYLKIADCYREGKGVKRDFLGMVMTAEMARKRGAINRIEDYLNMVSDGDDFKRMFQLIDSYRPRERERGDSIIREMAAMGIPDALALAGIMLMDRGDSIEAAASLDEASAKESTLAYVRLNFPDGLNVLKSESMKLLLIADRLPFAYAILGNLYYEPDENGDTDRQRAVEYYLKAEQHAFLGSKGARRVLDYYREGGNVQLTEDDIKRLELLVDIDKGVDE